MALNQVATGGAEAALGSNLLAACAFLGKLFMNALKMIIVPLVASSKPKRHRPK